MLPGILHRILSNDLPVIFVSNCPRHFSSKLVICTSSNRSWRDAVDAATTTTTTTTKNLMSDKKRDKNNKKHHRDAGVPADHAQHTHSQGCHSSDGNRSVDVHNVPGLPQNASHLEGSTWHHGYHHGNSYRVNPVALFQQQRYYAQHVAPFNPLSVMYFHRQNSATEQTLQQQQQRSKHTQFRDVSMKSLRTWEKLASRLDKQGISFTVMSYNVLAQKLLESHPYLYKDHQPQHLPWERRWKNILSEIRQHRPAVLCLQEVQESHLKSHYNATLKGYGYKGIFKKRTGPRPDGCAIYYNKDLLKLIEHVDVEYRQPSVSVLDRDNVALIAKFAFGKDPGKQFVVATTHLLYNPRRDDVKLAQTQLLLTEIDRLAYCRFMDCSDPYLPVIVTGDLNSTPNSAVYKLLTSGEVNYEKMLLRTGKTLVPSSLRITDECQHADLLTVRQDNMSLTRSEEMELIKLTNSNAKDDEEKETNREKKASATGPGQFSSGILSHKFALSSVYQHYDVNGDIEGTTFQDEWVSVDYIFYSKMRNFNKLTLLARYKLPTEKQLNRVQIPNGDSGSDHLPLVAKFHLE